MVTVWADLLSTSTQTTHVVTESLGQQLLVVVVTLALGYIAAYIVQRPRSYAQKIEKHFEDQNIVNTDVLRSLQELHEGQKEFRASLTGRESTDLEPHPPPGLIGIVDDLARSVKGLSDRAVTIDGSFVLRFEQHLTESEELVKWALNAREAWPLEETKGVLEWAKIAMKEWPRIEAALGAHVDE